MTITTVNDTNGRSITELIEEAVKRDARVAATTSEVYFQCLDGLIKSHKSAIINGNMFSAFSGYFIRYLSVIAARGNNIVFVCNTDAEIQLTYDFLVEKFSEITSLYCKNQRQNDFDFDDPIWKIIKIEGSGDSPIEASVDEKSILVTSLKYLSSSRFELNHERFIHLIDTVVFVNTLETVNKYNRQLAIFNTRVKHIAEANGRLERNAGADNDFRVRYMAHPVRYICFDDSRTPGLDKVLKNLTALEFESLDAMLYNSNATVRCYNYDGLKGNDERIVVPQLANTFEELGPMMNVALQCLESGAKSVAIFADGDIPYENIAESIRANSGNIRVNITENSLRINRAYCDASDYSVIIAMDSEDNLPKALRKYVSLSAAEKTLIIVFSKPYMLRDFYYANIDKIWDRAQIARIPVENGTKRDFAQKVLIKAGAGGITVDEVFRLALSTNVGEYRKQADSKDIIAILAGVLDVYDVLKDDEKPENASLNEQKRRYRGQVLEAFEFRHDCTFNENGKFCSEDRVFLRSDGTLLDFINGRDMASLALEGKEKMEIIPLPRSRITQNHIAGQNLVYNGNIYTISSIDTKKGILYARLASAGNNAEVHRYIQNREYIVHFYQGSVAMIVDKHIEINRSEGDVSVNDAYVSVFRAPTEVITHGYYEISASTFSRNAQNQNYHDIDGNEGSLAGAVYRRYGRIPKPHYKSEPAVDGNKGALMMTIRLTGKVGTDPEKTMRLAAAMIGELIRSMFPSVADSVAVCASVKAKACKIVDIGRPELKIEGENTIFVGKDFEITIIEDSNTELGVVSALAASGEDVFKTLFSPLDEYLEWYYKTTEKKNNYLYCGRDDEPEEYDFLAFAKLASLLANREHELSFENGHAHAAGEKCDFCGRSVPNTEKLEKLSDGRRICKNCKQQIVASRKGVLKDHLMAAKIFLESTYGVRVGAEYSVSFESAEKIISELKTLRESECAGDIPLWAYSKKKKISVETGLPSANLTELFVRELTKAWQQKHIPGISQELAQGLLALVDVQYLRFANRYALADERERELESSFSAAGVGYKELSRKLTENPQYRNNPFLYLLSTCSGKEVEELIPPVPRRREVGEGIYGKKYTPEEFDRVIDGTPEYFYRKRLSSAQQTVYDTMVNAIMQHADSVDSNGLDSKSIRAVSRSIEYDRPDLFWYESCRCEGERVILNYCADENERERCQRQIDEAVPKFIKEVTDRMSAYDAAIRVYTKVVNETDYDTIALNEQKANGGPKRSEIDYLRTICGVFIKGTAVCEGYARALAYLMQKCGIECAEVAGNTIREDGSNDTPHAWNIIKIDGEYYYMDVTWDDNSNTNQPVRNNSFGYKYFCVTTEEIQRTRKIDLCPIDVPICTATAANYYQHNSLILTKYDLKAIERFAAEAAECGADNFSFKCESINVYKEAIDKLFVGSSDGFAAVKAAARADKKIDGTTYSYTWDDKIRTITVRFKYKKD